jgi:hypothetical protein
MWSGVPWAAPSIGRIPYVRQGVGRTKLGTTAAWCVVSTVAVRRWLPRAARFEEAMSRQTLSILFLAAVLASTVAASARPSTNTPGDTVAFDVNEMSYLWPVPTSAADVARLISGTERRPVCQSAPLSWKLTAPQQQCIELAWNTFQTDPASPLPKVK